MKEEAMLDEDIEENDKKIDNYYQFSGSMP